MKIPVFKTLTVPLDGTEVSERVLPLAIHYAATLDIRIELVSIPHFSANYGLAIPDVEIQLAEARLADSIHPLVEDAKQRTRAYLLEHAEHLQQSGREVGIRVGKHRPARTIVSMASEAPDALVLMATHSRSAVGRWLFGSVAERVLQLTTRPLLLVPALSQHADQLPRRILVALDGSAAAEMALPEAISLARSFASTIVLLHVEPDFGEMLRGGSAKLLDVEGQYQDWLSSYFAGVETRIAQHGVPCESKPLGGGHPVDTLIAESARQEAGLLVLATHGGGGPGRWPVGSVTNRVVRGANLPVLVVPSMVELA